MDASNHAITAWLDGVRAKVIAQDLAHDAYGLQPHELDDVVAAQIGRRALKRAWPWLELCVRGAAAGLDPATGRRALLLSGNSPHPPAGDEPCPFPTEWGVPTVRVIVQRNDAARSADRVLAVERYRAGEALIRRLRAVGRSTPSERCYP